MAKLSIDYLNARRDAKPASGGKRYVVKRNAVDDKAQWNSLDGIEQVACQIDHVFADFHRWIANLQPVESIMRGESLEDFF
jgi:hypothetical protein